MTIGRVVDPPQTECIILYDIKDPDGWGELFTLLGVPEEKWERYLEFSEYANLELEFDQDLNVVRGRILERAV